MKKLYVSFLTLPFLLMHLSADAGKKPTSLTSGTKSAVALSVVPTTISHSTSSAQADTATISSRATAVRIETPPVIDGTLNDEVWNRAAVITDFYQREPSPGAPVSEKTEVFICYNEHHLYFGFRCWDDPDKITAREMARDISLGNDDRVQIILDTFGDRKSAYWFQIGPLGSIGDAIVSENGANLNKEWDGVWTGKAEILADRWEAEIAIPFKTLGFDKASDQWGMKLIRNIIRKLEASYWPSANINNYRFSVADAGTLDGLTGMSQGIGLDITPYVVAGLDAKRGTDLGKKRDGGADIFYQITPGLKASLTINTDFAETEVDDRQINLTRFNLHFPEKRDFFLDGSNYFMFGIEADQNSSVSKRIIPFFTRRIGLGADGSPIPINYGGKLTGQFGRWKVGMLHINDDHDEDGTAFSVARVGYDIGRESTAGIIYTRGNAIGDNQNETAGADIRLASSTFMKNKNINLFLFGLQSYEKEVKDDNGAWGVQFGYPNDFLNFRAGYHEIGRNFNAGVGFVPRKGIRETYGELMVGPRPDKFGILQLLFGGSADLIRSDEGIMETRDLSFVPLKIRFKSGIESGITISNQYEFLKQDFAMHAGVVVPSGKYDWWRMSLRLKSNSSRKIWTESSTGWGGFYEGSRRDFSFALNWKVAVPFFLGLKYIRNNVDLPQGEFTAHIFQSNLNFLFSPAVTWNNILQYDNDSEIFGFQSRFQWIVKPGREVILVLTSRHTPPYEDMLPDEAGARIKLKYNIRF